jgi:sugar/nucleoside kinase (ribokinase family)
VIGLFVGLSTVDIIHSYEGVLLGNTKHVAKRQLLAAGGPACNAAVAFSATGGQAVLASVIGQHVLSSVIKDDMSRCGVELVDLCPEFTGEPTVSSIIVDERVGSRIIVSARATRLPRAVFDLRLMERSPTILLVDGHLAAAVDAARAARERGIPVVLDSGSWKDGMELLIPHVDIAICSEDFRAPFEIRTLVQRGAITRGERSILAWDGGERFEIEVPTVRAVDTLGAGDVFHGAFCRRYAELRDLRDSLQFAARVAAFRCRYFGTRDWIRPFQEESL